MVSIGSVDYGRSTTGRTQLVTNLKSDLNKAKSAFKQLTDINNAVKKYWAGADADRFMAQLKTKADAAAKKCDTFKSVVESALATDDKNFRALQDKITF